MNNDNIADLEANGYKYIIGAKIKNESRKIQEWILGQPKTDGQMVEYDKGNGQRLLVGYTEDRVRKDAYNREKGIRVDEVRRFSPFFYQAFTILIQFSSRSILFFQ